MTRRQRSPVNKKATARKKPVAETTAGPTVVQKAPPLRQQFFVIIENLMAQALEVSVLNESGSVTGLRLGPRGKSHPIAPDRVGTYTQNLVEKGHVRIVQTNG